MTLFCHGTPKRANALKSSSVGLGKGKNVQSLKLRCDNGDFFIIDPDQKIPMEDLQKATCIRIMEPLIIREDSSDCSHGVGADGRTSQLESITLVKVGWDISGHFDEQIIACIDEKVYGTLWTKHVVRGPSIEFRDKSKGRPSFRLDTRGFKRYFTEFTATKVTRAYSKKSQVKMISELLGTDNTLPDDSHTPIIDSTTSGTNYFAKGHLSPDAAFIDEAEQDATYFFFNVAPQFQSFNNGNWKALEYVTRDMAAKYVIYLLA